VEGLLIWVAYWIVESFLLHILPWLAEPSYAYVPPDARFTAVLLALYAAAGVVTGAIAGIALVSYSGSDTAPSRSRVGSESRPGSDDSESRASAGSSGSEFRIRPAITLVLCAVVLVSVLPNVPRGLPAWFVCLLFLPTGAGLAASLFSSAVEKRFRVVANAWVACAVLLALPMIVVRTNPRPPLMSAALSLLPFAIGALAAAALTMARPIAQSARRTAVLAALLLIACFVLHQQPRELPPRAARTSSGKPDVILITLDTVRADHLSLYGYVRDTTPNLRALAQHATVYTNAISAGDMTLSSHASIFTGLYPSWHQAHFDRGYEWGRPLDSKYPTLAEILAGNGFDTAAIISNYLYLAPGFGLDRGFLHHDSAAPVKFLGTSKGFLLRERVRNSLTPFFKPWQYDPMFRNAEEIDSAALAFFDREKAQGRRFFGFLNYMDAHWPYLPPGRFATMYPGYDPHIRTNHYDAIEREVVSLRRPMSAREREHLLSQYDGSIAYLDWALGKLIEALKQRGLYDNTLLVITSDHGEAFGERGIVGHALSVYQDLVHVPLLIKYPGQTDPASVSRAVSLTSLMPTILTVLGYPAPKTMQGRSLWNAPPGEDGNPISETFVHPLISIWSPRLLRSQQAIFSGSMKYIQSSKGQRELYDLSRDPNEEHDLSGAQHAEDMEASLARYIKAAAADNRRQTPAKASIESVEKLRSLGYIGR
jgi:arylsulfatase A-like enzyme